MTFGEEWGWGSNKEASKKMYDCFLSHGGNFLDTANRYTEGTSERFVGEFIKSERDHIVLATKFTLFDKNGDPNYSGNHKKNMIRSLEGSLKRLQTDYVDILWVHAWDFTTDVRELMRALNDAVASGKVLHIGISDTPAWIVAKANTLAECMGWTPFSCLQIEYSLFERTAERDLLPMANDYSMTVTPWAPLAGGLLTGKYTDKKKLSEGRLKEGGLRKSERGFKIAEAVDEVAHRLGKPQSQVALNWIRRVSNASIPIVGATSEKQLDESLRCLEFSLSDEDVSKLSFASDIEVGFPHDFLKRPAIQEIIYGGTRKNIDI
ncbi:hypothetical protein CHS0354_023803 [Potamilus streckersoni]|uniref:NADP-dependent oxidoreductase domain-containing protein n=1 Tax=Potamilus streckersoni TaxID=2493646 RepID=A0AAE0RZ41_9BIVA|nr:hypothetical protein CHS0354_023803 [Potamilus streckersoni]